MFIHEPAHRRSFRRAAISAGKSVIPKKPAPDLIRGGYRFSEKIMLRQ
jgi:hypothetical protein